METALPVTRLLIQWGRGEQECLHQLLPLVHTELRRIAKHRMRMESPGHTLQATALVNEAYLRLVDQSQVNWQDRTHFFAIAARLMRQILVDHARAGRRDKRGGGACHIPLDEGLVFSPAKSSILIALDDGLAQLGKLDARKAKVVELRYFGGLSVEETAEVLHTSLRTVMRDWNLAKVWLRVWLKRGLGGTADDAD